MAQARGNHQPKQAGSGLAVLLAVAIIVLFFVASIAVSFVFVVLLSGNPSHPQGIGINYGRVADNLPPPSRAVELIKSLNIGNVKIYDANADVLRALSGSNLRVSIMVPNQEIDQMASSSSFSDQWVQQNVVAWYPATRIETVIVGNEILSDGAIRDLWVKLVPAMENLQESLDKAGLGKKKIKVTTSLAVDCLQSSYPPSEGVFREDVAETVMRPMLKFLGRTNSFFFINVYPYFAWASDRNGISLDYALFGGSSSSSGSSNELVNGGLHYENLLDAQLDALVMAMTKMGYGSVPIAISETGWPSMGDTGASLANAAAYNRRLVRRMVGGKKQQRGTPRRPGRQIPTFIFSLFNEDLKPGAATERNWGLLYPNGSRVYEIDLTGKMSDEDYARASEGGGSSSSSASFYSAAMPQNVSSQTVSQLPMAAEPPSPGGANASSSSSSSSSRGSQWCVVANIGGSSSSPSSMSAQAVEEALDYACGKSDCRAIQPGQPCYLPNVMQSHASYAFNSYWQKNKRSGGSCSFNGAAKLTTVDPSYGSCVYQVL